MYLIKGKQTNKQNSVFNQMKTNKPNELFIYNFKLNFFFFRKCSNGNYVNRIHECLACVGALQSEKVQAL